MERSTSSHSRPDGKSISTWQICVLALIGGLIFATKFVLASLPNVNLNTLLIIICVVFFGWKTFYSVIIYVLLEGLVFGFGIWWFSYLYAWPVVTLIIIAFRKNDSAFLWAVIAGICGLLFGPLMYLLYFAVFGWQSAFAMWIAGIPYDLLHCLSNFFITLILYKPLYRVFHQYIHLERAE